MKEETIISLLSILLILLLGFTILISKETCTYEHGNWSETFRGIKCFLR